MNEKYGYEKQSGNYGKEDMVTPSEKESAVRREFNGVCKLIEHMQDRYNVLEEKISPILYVGPFPEGEGKGKCEPESNVQFANELATQRAKLSNFIDRINNTIKRVEI